jgi:diacylglycerol kinase (ATP)
MPARRLACLALAGDIRNLGGRKNTTSMRKAVLLYNPLSGRRRRQRRDADVDAAATVLRQGGVEVSVASTQGRSEAAGQTREAIAQGCDTVFACGGDGTIHDVVQGLVDTQAALGIIPLGTANALAHDLRIPLSASAAAHAALTFQPCRIAAGRIEFANFKGECLSRHFAITAGVGVDAQLFYGLKATVKGRLGMAAYYAMAWRLWMTHRLERFCAEYSEVGSRQLRREILTQLLAVRIRNFGGVLRELAPGADLRRDSLRLVLCSTDKRSAYFWYILRGFLGRSWRVGGIELADSECVRCDFFRSETAAPWRPQTRIYVEADGELLGTLPATISVVPNALTILMPG